MGHNRLGGLAKSKKWRSVVEMLTASSGSGPAENIDAIAAQTLEAAKAGLENAKSDAGLRYTFFLLTQIVLASRHDDWRARLARVGIQVGESSSLFDLAAETHLAADNYISRHGRPSDVSEIAQQAAGDALASLASLRSASLFGRDKDELRDAMREMSTKSGFCRLGRSFFSNLLTRYLNFYLSRATARQVGGLRLPNVEAVSDFNKALSTHCDQSARIVYDFCGGWYAKTEYAEGIDLGNTSRFMAHALTKLQRELSRQGDGR